MSTSQKTLDTLAVNASLKEELKPTSFSAFWKITDVKALMELSSHEGNQGRLDSPAFGDGRWRMQFHASSSVNPSKCCLFLVPIPTAYERERGGVQGRPQGGWSRGPVNMTLDIRATKSAATNVVSKTSNASFNDVQWALGYEDICTRKDLLENNEKIRTTGTMLIVCTLMNDIASPTIEMPLTVYKAVSGLFNNPAQSDIVFHLKSPDGKAYQLYAASAILRERSAYFKSLLGDIAAMQKKFILVPRSKQPLPSIMHCLNEEDQDPWFSRMSDWQASMPGDNGAPIEGEQEQRWMYEIVIPDASLATFASLLLYLYTDHIRFAPLASTYAVIAAQSSHTSPLPYTSHREYALNTTASSDLGAPHCCSAKAVYRKAKEMNLVALQTKAEQFLKASLTVETAAYELFSAYTQSNDDVYKAQLVYLLQNWDAVSSTQAYKTMFAWEAQKPGSVPGFKKSMDAIQAMLKKREEVRQAKEQKSKPKERKEATTKSKGGKKGKGAS